MNVKPSECSIQDADQNTVDSFLEKQFESSTFDMTLKNKKIAFLDLDGTLLLGDEMIEGADKFLEHLQNIGVKYYFFSNNSSKSKEKYVEKLAKFNIEASIDQIILSTDGAIRYLNQNNYKNIYVLGTDSMKEYIEENGISITNENPEVILIGYDTELNYQKLQEVCHHIYNGVEFMATHPDKVCPHPKGDIPDIGLMTEMIENTTKRKLKKCFGKPNKEMLEFVLNENPGISHSDVIVVGDRIYTDGLLAYNTNVDFVCVLSGETTIYDIEQSAHKPAVTVKSVASFL